MATPAIDLFRANIVATASRAHQILHTIDWNALAEACVRPRGASEHVGIDAEQLVVERQRVDIEPDRRLR